VQGVHDDQQRRTRVSEDGEPQAGVSGEGKKKDGFHHKSEGDIELDDAAGAALAGGFAVRTTPIRV
jgi:hypothetical protein